MFTPVASSRGMTKSSPYITLFKLFIIYIVLEKFEYIYKVQLPSIKGSRDATGLSPYNILKHFTTNQRIFRKLSYLLSKFEP
jgi:hypothetical protein